MRTTLRLLHWLGPRRLIPLAICGGLLAASPAAADHPRAAQAGPASAALRSSLPILTLRTQRAIRDDPKVRVRVRLIDHGRGNTPTRRANGYDGWGGIEIRGQSSQRFPKKSYALELRTRGGTKRDAGLLGLPPDDDWVLYAAYNDKTLMRNVLAYRAARLMGHWAARTRFVEVVLNGRYHGVYVLMERPELKRGRVELPQAAGEPTLLEFTFPFQARRKGPFFRTPILRRPIVWEDPERRDMTSAHAQRVKAAVGRVERALYRGGRGAWKRVLEPRAAVDYVLVQELFRNVDAFHGSTFMTVPETGRLRLGPVWDFDLSSGNANYGESIQVNGWRTADRDWAKRLHRDPTFRQALRSRWRELRSGGFRREILATIARAEREVGPAVNRNFRRWRVLNRRVWPNPAARGSWPAEVRYLRGWLVRRMNWMDRATGARGPR